jgi:hypothetical protein
VVFTVYFSEMVSQLRVLYFKPLCEILKKDNFPMLSDPHTVSLSQ